MFAGRYFGARYFGGRYYGKRGLLVLGSYDGARYFGKHYFGRRYFGSGADSLPFSLAQTNTIGLSGVVLTSAPGSLLYTAAFNVVQTVPIGLTASTSYGGALLFEEGTFIFGVPLEVTPLAGVVGITGDLVFTASAPGVGSYYGGRYFGARYFGHRYWGVLTNFNVTATNTIGLSGVALTAGGFTTTIGIAQTNTLGFSGVAGVAGDVLAGNLVETTTIQPAGRGKKNSHKKRYIARFKGVDYEFESVEEVESFIAQTKVAQTDTPKRFRAAVKVSLTPEFAEVIEPVVDIPPRIKEMPTGAAMAQIRKLEDILSKATIPTDDEEDEIISWLM